MSEWYKNQNGFLAHNETWIKQREHLAEQISTRLKDFAQSVNSAWTFNRVETPIIEQDNSISDEYEKDKYYQTTKEYGGQTLSLRPETPMGSYHIAQNIINQNGQSALPLCVWQHGLSFRDEQNHGLSKMRLQQFYQLEFQCLYHESTYDDYAEKFRNKALEITQKLVHTDVQQAEEDEDLPHYSKRTVDLELKGLELCSMSERTDFPDDEIENIEIAFGTDRLVYAMEEFSCGN